MRSFIAAFALCIAVARPQAIDIAAVHNLPKPDQSNICPPFGTDTYGFAAGGGKLRSPGPVPRDGSVAAYIQPNNILGRNAQDAKSPSGYIQNYKNLQAGSQQIYYLTYKIIESGKYDVASCAAFCNSEKYCNAFNIYYERVPSVKPTISKPNPAPVTIVKCALFGYPLTKATATNVGQYPDAQGSSEGKNYLGTSGIGLGKTFQAVIVGSNAYSKKIIGKPPALYGFDGPTLLPAAIKVPTSDNTINGNYIFNTGKFDPSVCARICKKQTKYDSIFLSDKKGKYRPCNFFNIYVISKNEVPLGTYCSFYTLPYDSSYAVNTGYVWKGDKYIVNDDKYIVNDNKYIINDDKYIVNDKYIVDADKYIINDDKYGVSGDRYSVSYSYSYRLWPQDDGKW